MRTSLLIGFCSLLLPTLAGERARWVWYPGDREIALGGEVQMRRIEKGEPDCVIWPEYSHWKQVTFSGPVSLKKTERVRVDVEGDAYIYTSWSGQKIPVENGFITLGPGDYSLKARVYNAAHPPAIRFEGEHVQSGKNWSVRWNTCGSVPVATADDCVKPEERPSVFRMALESKEPVSQTRDSQGLVADFGRETFGFPILKGIEGRGTVRIVYAESPEEANGGLDVDVWENVALDAAKGTSLRMPVSRAFRYIRVTPLSGDVRVGSLSMEYEYLPLAYKGSFRCNDEEINRIWDVAAYTLHLTTREFYLDGIKRDRWVWSGDTRQSVNMAAYLFADSAVTRRTLSLLGGKDPIGAHINTILDYTLFWIMSVGEYYLYSGDADYLREIWPRVKAQTEYCLAQTNEEGFLVDKPGDWVFVDWAPGPMTRNGGALAFEQILFVEALSSAARTAELAGDSVKAVEYARRAADLRGKIMPTYWSEERQGLLSFRDREGRVSELTRYPNIFGLFCGYFTHEQRASVVKNVLENDSVMKIVTPYMRYYELESLCFLGRQKDVTQMMKDYWGGMLKLGATSFWEEYDPAKKGAEHYAMYGRPFGKSLCHAWGASPVYLLGRYYLGVKPTAPGFATYEVCPNLGELEWMEGRVPAPFGEIRVKADKKRVEVQSDGGRGTLVLPDGRRLTVEAGTCVRAEF